MSGWDQEYDLHEWGIRQMPERSRAADGIVFGVAIGIIFWIGVFVVSRRLFIVLFGAATIGSLVTFAALAWNGRKKIAPSSTGEVEVAVGYWACETCGTRVEVEVDSDMEFSPVFGGQCHCGRTYEVLPRVSG